MPTTRPETRPPGRTGARLAQTVVLAAGLAVAATVACAQPLVLSWDLERAPTHGDLVRVLGQPAQAEVRAERLEPRPGGGGWVRSADSGLFGKPVTSGGEFVLHYPALGLVASIDREDRPLADPPIRWLQFSAPQANADGLSSLQTPQGLIAGQPREQALALAAQHLQPQAGPAWTSPDGEEITRWIPRDGGPLAWARPAYEVRLAFGQDQRLRRVHVEFKPGLTRSGRWALVATVLAIAAVVSWGLRWLWQHPLGAPALPLPGAGAARWIGRGLLSIGVLLGTGSLAALSFSAYIALADGGNAYGLMGAYALAVYALIGLLMGGVLAFLGRQIEASG